MNKTNTICKTLNENFIGKEFIIDDILPFIDTEIINKSAIRQLIHYGKLNGDISIIGQANKHGRENVHGRTKIYKLNNTIQTERLKRIMVLVTREAKGLIDEDQYTDEKHPSKRYITEHFYTTYSVYSNRTATILSLCGPNVERFARNVLKITDAKTGRITLVECDEERSEEIKILADSYKDLFPKYRVFNTRLEDFLSYGGFYQFQDLDCEGNWKLLYGPYQDRLIDQAKDTKYIKGMIFTTFARREGISKLNPYISSLLSNIGAKFRNNKVIEEKAVKKIPSEKRWHYVHLYDRFPFSNQGRIIKLVLYRYAQSGCGMFSGLVIYK
jgi:hypothetical protein